MKATEIDTLAEGRAALQHTGRLLAAMAAGAVRDRIDELVAKDDKIRSHICFAETRPPTAEHGEAAKLIADVCARDLGIDTPPVVWMAPETDLETCYAIAHGIRDWPHVWWRRTPGLILYGLYTPSDGTVWINAHAAAERPLYDVLATVAHEVRHAAGGNEPEARAYGPTWPAILNRQADMELPA